MRLGGNRVALLQRIGEADGGDRPAGAQSLQRRVIDAAAIAQTNAAPVESRERREDDLRPPFGRSGAGSERPKGPFSNSSPGVKARKCRGWRTAVIAGSRTGKPCACSASIRGRVLSSLRMGQ